jgi:hypothetical protein
VLGNDNFSVEVILGKLDGLLVDRDGSGTDFRGGVVESVFSEGYESGTSEDVEESGGESGGWDWSNRDSDRSRAKSSAVSTDIPIAKVDINGRSPSNSTTRTKYCPS